MAFPQYFWILLLVAFVLLFVGYYKFVWFLSVGYGLSIFGIGTALMIIELVTYKFSAASLLYLAQCLILMVYGLRLSVFLIIREIKNATYRKTLSEATGGENKKLPIPVEIVMQLVLSLLYFAQTSPVFYRLSVGEASSADACLWIGVIISLAGVVLEALSDYEKSKQKKENPDMVATKGLFKMCRCPNYFGEILVWTGVFISGCSVIYGWQWLVAILGYICIVYIMFNGAQRLEKRQNKNYGSNPAYQAYVAKTPIIIPLIPLYHLNKKNGKQSSK